MNGRSHDTDAAGEYGPQIQIVEQGGSEYDVTGLLREIENLGLRLQSPELLKNPRVRTALERFGRQVASALGPGHGRHRVQGAESDMMVRSEATRGTWGSGLKPNPLAATTSVEFVTALRQYRAWAGNTSFRQMAARAHQVVAHSTMCAALKSNDLPALKVVVAIIIGCGGNVDDQAKFTAAWRRINSGNLGLQSVPQQLQCLETEVTVKAGCSEADDEWR